ncbi:hypothetical protein LCGC14_0345030 [marine sediment metagenome]|uniref:Uncharacterized protein n=1 Tax=marine sediment metagenome TaxID=412755 RepID=A0A0F9TVQ0_9ZZZZ
MKTIEEVHNAVDEWFGDDMVGNLIIYRAPNSQGAECILEEVVKAREMKPTTRAALEMLMDDLNIERGEMWRDKEGNPDRVRGTRRFDIE